VLIEEYLKVIIMDISNIMKAYIKVALYNMKIIFSGKFIWFMIVGVILFGLLMFSRAYEGSPLNEGVIYSQLLIPALLLVFYPSSFGIQNDADNRILEILFGIPNYMYKVWLFRLLMIYIEVYFIIVVYALLADVLLFPNNPFEMAAQLMVPVMLFGNMAFFYSTITRNGNATAVLIILTSILLLILSTTLLKNKYWSVIINPFDLPENIHSTVWEITLIKNRILMIVAGIIFLMSGLFNLQKREKFL
jgi:hypothetical protein